MKKKTLIVYYSMSGNTEYAAKRIAERSGAQLLELKPKVAYKDKGFAKYLWGGKSAIKGEQPALEEYSADLTNYERLVFGFPVWASNVSPPLRTFIGDNADALKSMSICVFACQKGSGAEKAFEKLRRFLGIDAFEATAVFIEPKGLRSDETDKAIDRFAEKL